HHTLKYVPKNITLAEPLIAGARERRMIWDLVLDAQAAEPAIGQVHRHLTAQQPLRTDTEGIANNEHSNHEHRIDRWAAERRVVARQLSVHPGKVQHSGDLAHLVIIRNDFIEAERIEKLPLVPVEPPHHPSPPHRIASERRNHRSRKPSMTFATKSAQMRPFTMSALAPLSELRADIAKTIFVIWSSRGGGLTSL